MFALSCCCVEDPSLVDTDQLSESVSPEPVCNVFALWNYPRGPPMFHDEKTFPTKNKSMWNVCGAFFRLKFHSWRSLTDTSIFEGGMT